MKEIIFATTNSGKLNEVKDFLNVKDIKLLSLNDFPAETFTIPVEDGVNFLENALIKARYYFQIIKKPVIADDSGLVVPSLNGEPGVYSSRYAGPNAHDSDNNKLLLEKLNDSKKNRKAFFKAVIIYKDAFSEKIFEGQCEGVITSKPKGVNGFGYDPVFYLQGLKKTFAELEPQEKSRYSHRGKAISMLEAFLKSH